MMDTAHLALLRAEYTRATHSGCCADVFARAELQREFMERRVPELFAEIDRLRSQGRGVTDCNGAAR